MSLLKKKQHLYKMMLLVRSQNSRLLLSHAKIFFTHTWNGWKAKFMEVIDHKKMVKNINKEVTLVNQNRNGD